MARLTEEQKVRQAAARRRSAARAAEEDALGQERKRQEWNTNGTRLTRAELEAGVHCRGCGQPIIDGLSDWPPRMKLTDEEKREYEAAEDGFRSRHEGCRGVRWSMSGSRSLHCGYCCPPPPLSERQLDEITRILRASRPDPTGLRTWRLTLTCDHVLDATRHESHREWAVNVRHCRACAQPRGVVTAVPLGKANDEGRE